MKDYGPKQCVICGKTFIPLRSNQKTCLDPQCQKERHYRAQLEYREKNYYKILRQNRESMAKKRGPRIPKPDTIVAIGYAERQIAESLARAGKVKTEL